MKQLLIGKVRSSAKGHRRRRLPVVAAAATASAWVNTLRPWLILEGGKRAAPGRPAPDRTGVRASRWPGAAHSLTAARGLDPIQRVSTRYPPRIPVLWATRRSCYPCSSDLGVAADGGGPGGPHPRGGLPHGGPDRNLPARLFDRGPWPVAGAVRWIRIYAHTICWGKRAAARGPGPLPLLYLPGHFVRQHDIPRSLNSSAGHVAPGTPGCQDPGPAHWSSGMRAGLRRWDRRIAADGCGPGFRTEIPVPGRLAPGSAFAGKASKGRGTRRKTRTMRPGGR